MLKIKDRRVEVLTSDKRPGDDNVKLRIPLDDTEVAAIPGYGEAMLKAVMAYRTLAEALPGKKAKSNRFEATITLPFLEAEFTLEDRPEEHETPCMPTKFRGKPKRSVRFHVAGKTDEQGRGYLTFTIPTKLTQTQRGLIGDMTDSETIYASVGKADADKDGQGFLALDDQDDDAQAANG